MKVFLVDDHKIFREGVSSLINLESDMEVVGSAGSLAELKDTIFDSEPDIILMDLSLGVEYGTDAIAWIKEAKIKSKILVLSMHRENEHVKKVIDSGADGFILKDAGTQEMISAIRMVNEGNTFYSPQIMNAVLNQLTKKKNDNWKEGPNKLSKRELEVLRLIALEKSNKEIADDLFISIRTVDTHRRNILDKIDAKNTASLVRFAIKNGIVDL